MGKKHSERVSLQIGADLPVVVVYDVDLPGIWFLAPTFGKCKGDRNDRLLTYSLTHL